MRLGRCLAIVAALAACDGGDGAAGGAGDLAWADMDASQRRAYMDEVVFPEMRDLFVAFDAERYASFSCESCHGTNREETGHAMPAILGPLPLEGTLDAAEARNPEMTAFMLDEVFPRFVELLDETKFDHDQNQDGYRCTGCHLVAE